MRKYLAAKKPLPYGNGFEMLPLRPPYLTVAAFVLAAAFFAADFALRFSLPSFMRIYSEGERNMDE